MRCEFIFLLTFLFWIYQTSTDSTFSVHTTCSAPPHDWYNEIRINCTICGFSGADFLKFEVEWYLQKNLSITSPAKSTSGYPSGNNTKYMWEFISLTSDTECEGNKTVIRLVDENPTSLSHGIYTCYVTLNGNLTKYSSVDLSSGEENISPNYVLIRIRKFPVAEIAESCRKYGYNILMNESVAKSVPLREKESVYFPVCPSTQINNRSISVCKPWISRVGCYNLTVDLINNSVKMDCRNINITNWNKSLPLIGNTTRGSCYLLKEDVRHSHLKVPDAFCSADFNNFQEDNRTMFLTLFSILDINPKYTKEIKSECVATYMDLQSSELYGMPCHESCDAYCTQHDGSNVTYFRHKKWADARKECHSLNRSLPNEDFPFFESRQFDNTSKVCLDLFKHSSVLFQPVIKLATKENGKIIINAPINYSEKLPYLCGTKIEKSNSRHCNITTGDFHESHARDTTTETLEFQTEMKRQDTSDDLRLPIIITSVIVGLLLMVLVFVCLITRIFKRKENQGNKSSTTEVNVLTDLCSEPIPGPGESKMKTKNHINAEEESAYSVADTKDNEYSQPLVNIDNNRPGTAKAVTSTDSEYADTDLGEYDVLRGQRTKRAKNTSSHCEFYDRTNNVITGIYDVTSNMKNENEYSMAENNNA